MAASLKSIRSMIRSRHYQQTQGHVSPTPTHQKPKNWDLALKLMNWDWEGLVDEKPENKKPDE